MEFSPLDHSPQRPDHDPKGSRRSETPQPASGVSFDPMQERALLRERNVPRPLSGAARAGIRLVAREEIAAQDERRNRASSPGAKRIERDSGARRLPRQKHPVREIGISLRPEERELMKEMGRFRLVAIRDAAEFIYGGSERNLRRDIAYLAQQGLVEIHVLNARRDGRPREATRFEALTLTRRGRNVLKNSGDLPAEQRIYSGLVKPREAEHDAQVYRAFHKERAAIERRGGRNLRPKLDFELKARFNRAVYLAQRADRDRDKQESKEQVAGDLDLKLANGRAVVPDLRIEYDLPSGGSAHVDVEIATAAYRQGHFAAKARAGFRIYVSNGDIGRLGAAVQDDHDIMSEILSL